MKMRKMNLLYILMIPIMALVGCASSQKAPIEALTRADIAVKRAEENRAIVDAAPLEMRLARERLNQAQEDVDQKNYTSAKRNADAAAAQAELAESKARLHETKAKTKDAKQGQKTLESELEHNTERDTQ